MQKVSQNKKKISKALSGSHDSGQKNMSYSWKQRELLMDFSVPADHRIKLKETEEISRPHKRTENDNSCTRRYRSTWNNPKQRNEKN